MNKRTELNRQNPAQNLDDLRSYARELGFVDLGATRVAALGEVIHPTLVSVLPAGLTHAVSVVARLSGAVLATLEDRPTPLYGMHYQRVNSWIDLRVLDLVALLQAAGFQALPIPASQVVDRGSQRGHLMHKLVAVSAGLGWIGRSNLFVTSHSGAQVRLATLLTDLPLGDGRAASGGRHAEDMSKEGARSKERGMDDVSSPMPNAQCLMPSSPTPLLPDETLAGHCGTCRACIERCPAGAIGERREEFRLDLCAEKIASFQRLMFVTRGICGVCQAACGGRGAASGRRSAQEGTVIDEE